MIFIHSFYEYQSISRFLIGQNDRRMCFVSNCRVDVSIIKLIVDLLVHILHIYYSDEEILLLGAIHYSNIGMYFVDIFSFEKK